MVTKGSVGCGRGWVKVKGKPGCAVVTGVQPSTGFRVQKRQPAAALDEQAGAGFEGME